MTDTERIATALLGWRRGVAWPSLKNRPYRWYQLGEHRALRSDVIGIDEFDHVAFIRSPCSTWPDFTTLDGCRLFEDALFAKLPAGCYRYGQIITMIRLGLAGFDGHPLYDSCLKATPAQRVAACLHVLDEAGL
jgi:hypothetical protein